MQLGIADDRIGGARDRQGFVRCSLATPARRVAAVRIVQWVTAGGFGAFLRSSAFFLGAECPESLRSSSDQGIGGLFHPISVLPSVTNER